MRIFLAGGTGAIGRRLVPALIDAGHEVVATTRSAEKLESLENQGAEAVLMNGLDRQAVRQAVVNAHPDVVIHQLTSLAGVGNLKKFDEDFAITNKLRTAGTEFLLAASREANAKRFIAQSFTGWPNERSGSAVKTELDPLDPHPTAASRQSLAAINYIEQTVPNMAVLDGIVLRYGTLYGPGTGFGEGGDLLELVRTHKLPVVGGGSGIWSFIHVDDAARATVTALDHGAPGIYNIVDDEPAPVSEWLPYLAETVHAKKPIRLPSWLARPMIGEHGVSMMTNIRGSSNAKAKLELQWQLCYPSWRIGFRTGLG